MKLLLIIIALCLTIGSFIDEASLVAAALAVNDVGDEYLALLYIANMFGAMVGSRLCAYLLGVLPHTQIVRGLFFVQAVMIALIYLADGAFVALMGFGLGAVGSVLWTAILSVVPSHCPKQHLDTANKILQTIKNLGAVAGPALIGLVYQALGKTALVYLAMASVVAGLGVLLYRSKIPSHSDDPTAYASTLQTTPNVGTIQALSWLFGKPAIKKALLPLSVIIILTSTLNVLLVTYINTLLQLGSGIYGISLTMMSLGLLLSPFLVSGVFGGLGRVRGAMLAAVLMGLSMVLLGAGQAWLVLVACLLIGVGNGVVNTLMGAFMMHTLGGDSKALMPYYVLCLQSCVLVGFGLSYFVSADLMGDFLLVAGALVMLVGVLGAVVNQPCLAKNG